MPFDMKYRALHHNFIYLQNRRRIVEMYLHNFQFRFFAAIAQISANPLAGLFNGLFLSSPKKPHLKKIPFFIR